MLKDNRPDSAPEIFTKDAFARYMREQWKKQGEALGENERLGIEISELIELSRARSETVEAPYLDLWVAILDELNSWLISLKSTIYGPAMMGEGRMSDFERSVVVILIKLISDTTSLRHLITLGFDGSARTLLRSIVEYMQVLVVIIDDPALATEFVKADTPETSNEFYFGHVARGKLQRRYKAAWARFGQADNDFAEFFASQQAELGQLLAGTSHPSFAGGTLTAMQFIESHPEEHWLGHWGAKSNMSVLTVGIYTSSILPLLLFSDFPFSGFEAWLSRPAAFDPANELHRHVRTGRSVLGSLIMSLSKESNIPHIFPEGLEPITDEQATAPQSEHSSTHNENTSPSL